MKQQEVTTTRFTFKVLAVVVFAASLAVVPTHAQQSGRMSMAIPFAFTGGETTLPAGTYFVWRTSAVTGSYLIRNVDGEGSAAVSSPPRDAEHERGRGRHRQPREAAQVGEKPQRVGEISG